MSDAAFRAQAANLRLFFGLCVAISVSVLVPILLAGRPCNDDLARSVVGSYGWVDNGRYLSNMLMRALELGASREATSRRSRNCSPSSRWLTPAYCWCDVSRSRRCRSESWLTLPLGTQPFFLQNLSYRFDSVTMATALLCSVGAIAIRHRRLAKLDLGSRSRCWLRSISISRRSMFSWCWRFSSWRSRSHARVRAAHARSPGGISLLASRSSPHCIQMSLHHRHQGLGRRARRNDSFGRCTAGRRHERAGFPGLPARRAGRDASPRFSSS